MARVLVCADGFFRAFSPIALEPYIESFINVLARHGNQVMPYIVKDFEHKNDWKKKWISYKSAQEVKKFSPEIVFAFNNSFNPLFFKYFNCPVFIVASDTPIYWTNKSLLKNNSSLYSVLYFNNDMQDMLFQEYNIPYNRQFLIPYSTDMRCSNKQRFDKDITFIGNFYNPNNWLFDYLLSNLHKMNNADKQKLRNLIINLVDELNLKHNATSKTIETYKEIISLVGIDAEYDQCISQISGILTSEKRIELLSELSDMDLHIYTWEQNLRSIANLYTLFKKCHFDVAYSTRSNEQIYNESKISLSLPHAQVNTGFSWRVCDIMASNSMLLSNPTDDLLKLFGGIIPTYKTKEELKDKCEYYLKHENERQDIVKICQKMIEKNHRYENVFSIVENISGIKLLNVGPSCPIQEFSRTAKKRSKYLRRL